MSVFIVSTALFVIGFAAQRNADVRDGAGYSTDFLSDVAFHMASFCLSRLTDEAKTKVKKE
ncbi:MAG TPA: hypothetical protein VFK06_16670 [Candidatus Angelobacter sp.]|nr:hypothetical protein [Candidatus Angelobacter sp.]